jgi:hypothetical protein
MDLHKELHPGESVVDITEASVNDNSNGRLRNPGKGFREDAFETVKVKSTETKSVVYTASALKGVPHSVVPLFDTWMSGEPTGLEELGLGY